MNRHTTLRHLLLATAAVVLLGACHSHRHLATSATDAMHSAPTSPTTTADTIATTPPLPKRQYTVANFTATVEGLSATGQMRIAADSAIWVSVTKLIEIGRAMATTDSVFINAPMAGVVFAGTYADLGKRLGHTVSFADLQAMATADDANQRIADLARKMGIDATVQLGTRRRVDALQFPFKKQQP